MSTSRPGQREREMAVEAELAGLRQSMGPLAEMQIPILPGAVLERRPNHEIVQRRAGSSGPLLALEPTGSGEDFLVWKVPNGSHPHPSRPPADGLLMRFARLAEADPGRILAFAKYWGPLRLCGHGLPGTHIPSDDYPEYPGTPGCPTMDLLEPTEAVADWRRYALEAASIIRITTSLSDGQPVVRSLWEPMRRIQGDEPLEAHLLWLPDEAEGGDLVESDADDDEAPADAAIVESQRDGLAIWINSWLAYSGAAPRYFWRRGGLVHVGSGGLFGALAYQMAQLLGGDTFLFPCDVCGDFVERTRKPQSGRRRYCDDPACKDQGRRRLSERRRSAGSS